MSPVPSLAVAVACATATSWSGCKSARSEVATSNSDSTLSFLSSIREIDRSLLPAVAATPTPSPAQGSAMLEQVMPTRTKIGLAMIPLVVSICAMWVFFVFWWRKRQMRKAKSRQPPPPIPSKDDIGPVRPSVGSSTYINPRCSKMCSMVAFTAPFRNVMHRETSVIGESRLVGRAALDVWPEEKRRNEAKVVRFEDPALRSLDTVSPIHGASPFRLKRGTTLSIKRITLGTEISSLWPAPSPPPTVWIKNSNRIYQVSTPVPVQENYF